MPPIDDIDRIYSKLDNIEVSISNIDKTLAAQHEQLVIHIKRTELLEKKIIPLENHVSRISGAWFLVTSIAVFAAIIEGLFTAFSYFKK